MHKVPPPGRLKNADDILKADPRFANLYVVLGDEARPMGLADHHATIASIQLTGCAPPDVQAAYDRARNTLIYAYFDYDLFVVGETQALGAFELALKHRLNGHGGSARGTLRNLVDRARKAGIFPPVTATASGMMDPIEALILLRNGLSHGTVEIHSPGMALNVIDACAQAIDVVFPPKHDQSGLQTGGGRQS